VSARDARSSPGAGAAAGRGRRALGCALGWAGAALLAGLPARADPLPAAGAPLAGVPRCDYQVLQEYPHRRHAFTQGLAIAEGRLFEGTGLNGHSSVAEIDLPSGEVRREARLPPEYFGEGLTVLGERVVQLTWREGRGFVYRRDGLEPLGEFPLRGEGWGLTHDGHRLLASDGTPVLRYLDPETFAETGRVTVQAGGRPLEGLNELEWVAGEVLANVWPTDALVRIDPASGQVLGWLDLAPLRARQGPIHEEAVANGIAYDPAARRLLLTGKLWSRVYAVRPRGPGCGALADALAEPEPAAGLGGARPAPAEP
jgi:glutamine cyclotransferase